MAIGGWPMRKTRNSQFSAPAQNNSLYAGSVPRTTLTSWQLLLVQESCYRIERRMPLRELQNNSDGANLGGIQFQLAVNHSVPERRVGIAVVVRRPTTPTVSDTGVSETSKNCLFRQTDSVAHLLCGKTAIEV